MANIFKKSVVNAGEFGKNVAFIGGRILNVGNDIHQYAKDELPTYRLISETSVKDGAFNQDLMGKANARDIRRLKSAVSGGDDLDYSTLTAPEKAIINTNTQLNKDMGMDDASALASSLSCSRAAIDKLRNP